jgi:hypothetical protein
MIPPVLNDLRALAELGAYGVDMDMERIRLASSSPMTDALASRVSFGSMGAETFVLYTNGRKQRALGVVQARLRKNRPEADITFIAPSLEHDPDAATTWYRLLSEATNSFGEMGVQRIYAHLPSGNGAEEVFRQAGFSVFTREDVYLLSHEKLSKLHSADAKSESSNDTVTLRRMRKRDSWNALRLYSAITPRSVQHSEAMRTTEGALGKLEDWWENTNGTSYLLERPGPAGPTVLGIVRVTRGRLASWVRLHLHPDAHPFADQIVSQMIALVGKPRARSIYVSVRDYEGGVRAALEDAGFEWEGERCHMVKHTTVRVRAPVPWLTPVLETPKIPAIRTTQHASER